MVAPNPFSFKHLIFCREAVQSLAELVLVSSKFVPYPCVGSHPGSPAMATRKTKCDRRNQGPVGE